MKLVYKLLKHHISIPQFAGYLAANLFGMAIVLLAVQFYCDVQPMFSGKDSFFSNQIVVVSKQIGAASSLSSSAGDNDTFSQAEISNLASQPFAIKTGAVSSSQYRATAAIGVGNASPLTTDLFFDAVPDDFVNLPRNVWAYTPGSRDVPIIMPRSYLALYNFGFAQSRRLPKISEGVAGMLRLRILVNTAAGHESFNGKVVGFSGNTNSMLVPEAFISWSNARFAPATAGQDADGSPTRLVVEVDPATASPQIAQYAENHGYEISDSRQEAGKATYFLRVVMGIVLGVGLVISALSFFILILSIYLLVEKNSRKIENLLLIGYSPGSVSKPYIRLSAISNALTLLISVVAVAGARIYYVRLLSAVYPQMAGGTVIPAICAGMLLYIVVVGISLAAVRSKILSIWKKKL